MADKDKPEQIKDKKRGVLGASKVPLDAVLLVVAPFVTFVLLFMYVMGLLPPRPMIVKVVGATPMEEAADPELSPPEEAVVSTPVGGPDKVVLVDEPEGELDVDSVLVEPADSGQVEIDGSAPGDGVSEAATPTPAGEEGLVPEEPSGEAAEVDGERMERVKQLAKVYEQMNASSVAAIVTTMNEVDAVDILSNMKPRNAAKVLASLAPEKAATLSLRLTE